MWLRAIVAGLIGVAFVVAWQVSSTIRMEVIGQPSATGIIQRDLERPFFENLASNTGLPIEIRYQTIDTLGIKDTHQLQMLREGKLDLVSLRFLQNATSEPTLLGIDPWGLNLDFQVARSMVMAYGPVLEKRLQERFEVKLLGVWPFGPQVFFCRTPIRSLADIAGLRVRVGNENFGPLIASFGATPVVIAFEEVKAALKSGMVDCAITSVTSGNAAGWADHSTHLFTLSTQIGLNGYVISMRLWNELTASQKSKFQEAFQKHIVEIWRYSEDLNISETLCSTGGSCTTGTPRNLVKVEPSFEDREALRTAFWETTFKNWAQQCDRVYINCSNDWLKQISVVINRDLGSP